MFSYYGSKSKIVHLYPPPKYGKIIEPFAGSARYALRYWDREILLVDKSDKLIRVWHWLQSCGKNDILKLPRLKTGLDIRKINISDIERDFLSYIVAASHRPNYIVTKFNDYDNGNQGTYKRIWSRLHCIKHWNIRQGCYSEIPNEAATWFIDPPYMVGGEGYPESSKNLNYPLLANWCKERDGQVIVCENTKSDWLPFKPLKKIQGASNHNTTEAIWSNHKTNYDNEQIKMNFA